MVTTPKKDLQVYFLWMEEIMQRIETYTKGYSFEKFNKDQKTIDAVIMMLVQLGETAFKSIITIPRILLLPQNH